MPKIIDLTHTVNESTAVFPGDPGVKLENAHHYENGYFVTKMSMGTHTGTHVDSPVHRIPGAKSVTSMGINAYASMRACVVDLTELSEGEEITADVLKAHESRIKGCDGILLKTGWSRTWDTPKFFDGYCGLSEDVGEYLKSLDIHIVGLESPSVNCERHLSVHESLLDKEITIVEALDGLNDIKADYFEFYALPLKLEGRDGSPVRAFALER